MKIINFYGGPQTGKTTLAYQTLAELKKRGKMVGFALEYATTLISRGLGHILEDNQSYVMINQYQLLYDFKRQGFFDYVVTDSPVLMQQAYFNPETETVAQETFNKLCLELHRDKGFENIEIFCLRDRSVPYIPEGRLHDQSQSRMLDVRIRRILDEHTPDYLVFDPSAMDSAQAIAGLVDRLEEEPTASPAPRT